MTPRSKDLVVINYTSLIILIEKYRCDNMKHIQISILALLISFGSIGAVIFTPGLPEIAAYFHISNKIADYTVTSYLFGYAFGQLLYGPLTNRFGNRTSIRLGAIIAIIGSASSIAAYYLDSYTLLILARCVTALGAACGLKMTFTLASKMFSHKDSARIMSLLTMAFAITPGLGVWCGGILVTHFNWTSPFYLLLIYAIVIFFCANLLPELYNKDHSALKLNNIVSNYVQQLSNPQVILGGLLVGTGTSFVYVFAAVAPFISMHLLHLSPDSFGSYNFIPSLGILVGSLTANHYGKTASPKQALALGLYVSLSGCLLMCIMLLLWPNCVLSLFLPMVLIYFGLSFIFGNAAAIALHHVHDKGNASAVMSFINMLSGLIAVSAVGWANLYTRLNLVMVYLLVLILGFIWLKLLKMTCNKHM